MKILFLPDIGDWLVLGMPTLGFVWSIPGVLDRVIGDVPYSKVIDVENNVKQRLVVCRRQPM